MGFKFSEIEGIDTELAEKLDADDVIATALEAFQVKAIEDGVTNRVEVAKGEFKKKMNDMDAKLKEAQERLENVPDITTEELKALREARDKNPELQATLAQMQKRTEEAESALQAQKEKLLIMQRNHTIQNAINEYNSAHPTTAVKSDMMDVVSMLAGDALRYDEDANTFKVYNKSGDIVATDKGAATPVDWLDMLRSDRPSLFKEPAGSGAQGSKQNGSATKKFSEYTEAELIKLYKEDRETYDKIRGTA